MSEVQDRGEIKGQKDRSNGRLLQRLLSTNQLLYQWDNFKNYGKLLKPHQK